MCTHNSSPHLCAGIVPIRDRTWRHIKGGQPLHVVMNLCYPFLHRTRVRVELPDQGIFGLGEHVIERCRAAGCDNWLLFMCTNCTASVWTASSQSLHIVDSLADPNSKGTLRRCHARGTRQFP